ncbi:MAG: hypothetical protein FK734_20470 [Asgard group archaeon]|nr:hypothetical protein [Asgard group archaeon]
MKGKHLKQIFLLGIVVLIILPINVSAETTNPIPFFTISLLAPFYMVGPNPWAMVMQEQLPKIGIGVNFVDTTTWTEIYQRTWNYGGTLPIPTYSEGGYDILFIGMNSGLDWNPKGWYDCDSIIPNGNNLYQYSDQEMDWAISNYTSFITNEQRENWGAQIQSILYDDLPEIAILYPMNLVTMDDDFTGWDGLLWENDIHTMENWSISGQTEFIYAIPSEIENFYIYGIELLYDLQWLNQIYSGLVARSTDPIDNHHYIPNIASDIESIDGLNYTITLNPNVKFADGITLNASDIEYSYNTIMDSEFLTPETYWRENLDVQSITILGEFELKISFKEQYVFQERNLALPILPKHIWNSTAVANQEDQAATWATTSPNNILGTGPYYLEEYNETYEFVHLKRNEFYDDWTGVTPYFEDIYFNFYSNIESALTALESEQIDMLSSHFIVDTTEVPETNCKYELVKGAGLIEMAINMHHPYIGTGELCPISSPESAKHIRKAISYMVPRNILIEEVLDGLGEPGITGCSPATTVFDDSLVPLEYSIDLAKAEMALAGVPDWSSSTASIDLPYFMAFLGLIGGCMIFVKKN